MSGKGRPKIDLNYTLMDELLQFKVSKAYLARRMRISEDTIEKRLREDWGMTFTQYSEYIFEDVKISLQKTALKMAIDDNVPSMVIFALKNHCGWKDKVENENINSELKIVIDKHDANF